LPASPVDQVVPLPPQPKASKESPPQSAKRTVTRCMAPGETKRRRMSRREVGHFEGQENM
ncbi:MAG TPA: hypothetical protein PK156_35990, partial [Polyangium sp.]|nr:hypothetical protein [Polyangium sp.]